MTVPIHFYCFAICLSILACSPPVQQQNSESTKASNGGTSNRVELPPSVRRNLGISFAPVEQRRVAQTIRVPGAFELLPRARHEYHMALSGRVELLVDQYEAVDEGQSLYRFQSPEWAELMHEILVGEQAIETASAEIAVGQAKLTEAQHKLDLVQSRLSALAEAEFKRADLEFEAVELEASLPRLAAEMDLSRTHLENAKRTREHALHRASLATAIPEEQLVRKTLVEGKDVLTYQTIEWIEVRAASAGIVESLDVTDGAFVESPATVLSTVDPQQVRFRALALQGDLPKLFSAIGSRIVPPLTPGYPIQEGVEATMQIGLEAHPHERTLTLLAVPNQTADWIRPGVSGFLEVVVGSSTTGDLAIPRSAILQDGLVHVFFRRDPADPNVVIRMEADMGISDGRWVVLHSGVREGDEVVLSGVYELKLATVDYDPSQGSHVHADGTTHDDH